MHTDFSVKYMSVCKINMLVNIFSCSLKLKRDFLYIFFSLAAQSDVFLKLRI